jgi:hypothetical protein
VEELTAFRESAAERLRRADQTAAQLKLVTILNRQQQDEVAQARVLLDEARITQHVRRAIAAAPLLTDPFEHIVVEGLLPDDVYDLLLRAIPPADFFDNRDPIKQNLTFPLEIAPALTTTVWEYMDGVIARAIIRPAVLEKFHGPLQRHFESMFGAEFVERANALPQSSHGGRVMLRRPGYHLGPHRDPKRVLLTCLMYLARPGDEETWGTQIFHVKDDAEATYKTTYYPEAEGHTCELRTVVPFRRNSMLVMLNSHGAHGADIPRDAPASLERYAYQFYVAPLNEALGALIRSLPPGPRERWQNRAHMSADYA